MRYTSFLLLLCISECIGAVLAICTVTKHERGLGDRIQCSNVTLETVLKQTSTDASAIMIFDSNMRYVPAGAFVKYERSLQSLNIHKCEIRDIHANGFQRLVNLKKLSLPNNNITQVKVEWFKDLVYLEQLDLSFNRIVVLEPAIFSTLLLLKRLDVRENRLSCLEASALPGGIDKVYLFGNPLTFKCRGKLTLWMRDHGVSYKSQHSEKETWLDKLLWHCAMDDAVVAESESLMKECVILNLFGQLRTGLTTAESYPLSIGTHCGHTRSLLTDCIAEEARRNQMFTNGYMIKQLLLHLHAAKSVR